MFPVALSSCRLPLGKLLPMTILTFCMLAVAGCGSSLSELDRLAAHGSIHEQAPVTAHVQIEIAAPVSRVWQLLIDAPAWPTWQKGIVSVTAEGPLRNGTSFTWSTSGTKIRSQVQLFEPERRLAVDRHGIHGQSNSSVGTQAGGGRAYPRAGAGIDGRPAHAAHLLGESPCRCGQCLACCAEAGRRANLANCAGAQSLGGNSTDLPQNS